MIDLKRETFHGMTHAEVWHNYEARHDPRVDEIEIVRLPGSKGAPKPVESVWGCCCSIVTAVA